MCCGGILQCETEGYWKLSGSNSNCSFREKGTILGRGNCERYTACVVVQYYNVRLKVIRIGAAATGIVALEKRVTMLDRGNCERYTGCAVREN
jgi:hypothetical protein